MNLRSALIFSYSHNAVFIARPKHILFCQGDKGGKIGFSAPAGSQSLNGLIQIALGTFDALMGYSSHGKATPQSKRQRDPPKRKQFQYVFLPIFSSKFFCKKTANNYEPANRGADAGQA
jgi:hypothetical protein